MLKAELKPIDVSKYKVTETGQVLKMTNFEKHANLDSIKTALIREQIPFEYNAKELTIKIKGIDMTDMLLAVHDYSSEFIRAYALEWGDKADETYACKETEKDKIVDLEKEIAELKAVLRNKKLAIQNRNGRIKELEEKIGVLLSCKNCPENKGGLICQKEYEDKCLAQKIQYIKELQKENAELKEHHKSVCNTLTNTHRHIREQLDKAKELIKSFIDDWESADGEQVRKLTIVKEAEQFLKEV